MAWKKDDRFSTIVGLSCETATKLEIMKYYIIIIGLVCDIEPHNEIQIMDM